MIRTTRQSRRRVVTLVIVVCMVAGGLGTATGTVTSAVPAISGTTADTSRSTTIAQNTSVNREAGVLVVGINRSKINADSVVKIIIETETTAETKRFDAGANKSWVKLVKVPNEAVDQYRIELTSLVDNIADEDLSGVSVSVNVDGEELARSDSEDLRYFEFGTDDAGAEFNETGTLRLPVSNVMGFRSDRTVPVDFKGETVKGTVVRTDEVGTRSDAVVSIPWKQLASIDPGTRADLRTVRVSSRLAGPRAEYTLEHLSFDGERKISLSMDGTLRLPVRTVGVETGRNVEVMVDGLGENLNGIIEVNDEGQAVLGIPVRRLGRDRNASDFRVVTFRVDLSGETTRTVDLLERARERASVETTNRGFRIHQPLFTDAQYGVTVATTSPPGTYANTIGGGDGVLTIDRPVLLSASSVNVSVYRDGETFVTVDKTIRTPESVTATLSSIDNRTVYGIEGLDSSMTVSRVYVSATSADSNDDGSVGISHENTTLGGSVEGGNVTLATPLRGGADASYRLLIVLKNGSVIRARATMDGANAQSGGGGQLGSALGQNGLPLPEIAGALILLTMVGFLGYVIQRTGFSPLGGVPVVSRLQGDRSTDTQRVQPAPGPSEPTLAIVLRDPVTGGRLDLDEQVHVQRVEIPGTRQPTSTQQRVRGGRATRRTHERQNRQRQTGTKSGRVTLRDGYAEVNLPQGQWKITLGGLFETTSMVSVREDTEVVLEPDPQVLSVQMNDSLTGEGLRETHVTVTPDVGDSQSGLVQDSSVTVQLSPRARRANVTVDHDRYDSISEEVVLRRGETQQVTLTLTPKTGTISPTVSVDGTPASGVRVESRAIDQRTRQYQRYPITGMTDERGRTQLQNCIVGEYDVTAAVDDGGRFTVPTNRITVESGSTSKVELELSIDFQLSGQQRERLERMNERLSNLTSVTGRDTAIPEYYRSVIQELLETIRRIPNLGHLFVISELDPVRLVDALLDQASTVVEQIATAMSSKRNTDLFTASRDLPPYSGGWSGEYDPDRLFELWGRDPTETRRLLAGRLDEVEERIRTEQTELASVAPARECWELAREHVGEERVEDAVRVTALAFVYEGYLDAIERLFDDPELRERLERTVF